MTNITSKNKKLENPGPVNTMRTQIAQYVLIGLCVLTGIFIIAVFLIRIVEVNPRYVYLFFACVFVSIFTTIAGLLIKKSYIVFGLATLFITLCVVLVGLLFEDVRRLRLATIAGLILLGVSGVVFIIIYLSRTKIVPEGTVMIQTNGKDGKPTKKHFPGTRFSQPINTKIVSVPYPKKRIRSWISCISRDDKPVGVEYVIYWQVKDDTKLLLSWPEPMPVSILIKDITDAMIGAQISRFSFIGIRYHYEEIRDNAENRIKKYLIKDLNLDLSVLRLVLLQMKSASEPILPPPNIIGGKSETAAKAESKPPPENTAKAEKADPPPQNNATKDG